jgi:hypothetical protein
MKQKPSPRGNSTKSILRLPDLELAKAAVLNSLNSADAKRGYRHAIDEFVDWYCSEPRLAFNRIVVLRYRSHLEFRVKAEWMRHLIADFDAGQKSASRRSVSDITHSAEIKL